MNTATSVDTLLRRIEAQIADQLEAAVALSSEPLAGRDLLGRGATVARLDKAGVSVADARAAAGIRWAGLNLAAVPKSAGAALELGMIKGRSRRA